MKGFLNKVAGNKPAGKPGDEKVAAPASGTGAISASAQAALRADATPRADISLPRGRERRYLLFNSFPFLCFSYCYFFKYSYTMCTQAFLLSTLPQNASCKRVTLAIGNPDVKERGTLCLLC